MIEKIRSSLLSNDKPQDKNVMWIDTSNPESFTLKLFRNGDWKPLHVVGTTRDMIERELTGYVTSHYHSYDKIINKPTTLTGYGITDCFNKTEIENLLNKKVTKVSGKSLSTNDFTNEDKNKLTNLKNYDDTQVRKLIEGKANLQHQHTVADIMDFPELYYDATAFFTSKIYPSDKYKELLEAVKAKKTVYAIIDEEGYVSYVFFMSSTNSDGLSSRVLLTTMFADGGFLYMNTFVLQQSGMTTLRENITGKANKATTLEGYGIGDAYTKSEVNTALKGKQNTISDLEAIRSNAQKGNEASNIIASIVEAGYVFAGVATPTTNPGVPDAKVFYIANGKGTYTNFGGVSVTEDEVVVLYWDSSWHKVSTGIASHEKLSELGEGVTNISESIMETEEDIIPHITEKEGMYINLSENIISYNKSYAVSYIIVKKDNVCNIAIDSPGGWQLCFSREVPSENTPITDAVSRGGAAKTATYIAPYDGYMYLSYVKSELLELNISLDRKTIGKDVLEIKKHLLLIDEELLNIGRKFYTIDTELNFTPKNGYVSANGTIAGEGGNDFAYYVIKNNEYEQIKAVLSFINTVPYAIAFYSQEQIKAEYFLSTSSVKAMAAIDKTYNVKVPEGCKLIVICTRIATSTNLSFEISKEINLNELKEYILQNDSRINALEERIITQISRYDYNITTSGIREEFVVPKNKFLISIDSSVPFNNGTIYGYYLDEKGEGFLRETISTISHNSVIEITNGKKYDHYVLYVASLPYSGSLSMDITSYITDANTYTTIEKTIDEVSLDVTDGENKVFHHSEYVNSENELLVYVNGLKKFLGSDYTVSRSGRYVRFNVAPNAGSVVGFHYNIKLRNIQLELGLDDAVLSDGKTIEGAAAPHLQTEFENFGYNTHQYMSIVNDPIDANKKVLACISASAETEKVRCQATINNLRASELDVSVDIYFPSNSIGVLRNYPNLIDWLTVQEFWSPFAGAVSSTPSYRATLGLYKRTGVNDLYFNLKCENLVYETDGGSGVFTTVASINDENEKKFPIPFDTWITLKTSVKYGSENYGHFKLEAIVNGLSTIIIDNTIPVMSTVLDEEKYQYTNYGYLSSTTSPLKMYTSSNVNNYVVENSLSHKMQLLFKNLNINNKEIIVE